MEYMALAEFVKFGTPFLLLALIILNVYQATVIHEMQKQLQDFKSSITWRDTCSERHDRIDERLRALERTVFETEA